MDSPQPSNPAADAAHFGLNHLNGNATHLLETLDKYGKCEAGLEEALTAVLDCDERRLRASDVKSMRDSYKRTLEDKPWQNCGCEFCQKLGIQVLIFRGDNRNRRRGAHNTAALYANIGKTK